MLVCWLCSFPVFLPSNKTESSPCSAALLSRVPFTATATSSNLSYAWRVLWAGENERKKTRRKWWFVCLFLYIESRHEVDWLLHKVLYNYLYSYKSGSRSAMQARVSGGVFGFFPSWNAFIRWKNGKSSKWLWLLLLRKLTWCRAAENFLSCQLNSNEVGLQNASLVAIWRLELKIVKKFSASANW